MKEIIKFGKEKFFLHDPFDETWFGKVYEILFNLGVNLYLTKERDKVLLVFEINNKLGENLLNDIINSKDFDKFEIKGKEIFIYFEKSKKFKELINELFDEKI